MSNIRVGETLDTTFRIYREHFSRLISLGLIVMIPEVLITLPMNRFSASAADDPIGIWIIQFFVQLASALLNVLVIGSVTILTQAAMRDEDVGFSQCVEMGAKAIPRIVNVLFVQTFLIMLGAALCIIPGIILALCYALSVPVAVLEGAKTIPALKRSRALTKGSRGSIFWVTLVLGLIECFIAAGFVLGPMALGGENFMQVGALAVELFLLPLNAILGTVMFVWLRDTSDGVELEYRVDRMIGTGPARQAGR